MRRLVTAIAALLLMAASGGQANAAAGAADQEKVPAAQAPAQAKRPEHKMVNVRLTLAITDETGAGEPVRKTVTLLLADGGSGRVRSSAVAQRQVTHDPRYQFVVTLNADAFIGRVDENRVQADITVEYSPGTTGDGAAGTPAEQRGSPLNQSVSVWLANGTPTVIVEASDPMSDRKVTLEATATIQR